MFRVLGNGSRCHGKLALDDLRDALGHICGAGLGSWCLLDGNHKIGHDVSGDLVIGLHKGGEEVQQAFKCCAGNERRMCNMVYVGKDLSLNHWEGRSGRQFQQDGQDVEGLPEECDVRC